MVAFGGYDGWVIIFVIGSDDERLLHFCWWLSFVAYDWQRIALVVVLAAISTRSISWRVDSQLVGSPSFSPVGHFNASRWWSNAASWTF